MFPSRLKSRKLIIGISAALGIIINDVLGKPVSDDAVYAALGVLSAYILAQGVADHGGALAATPRPVVSLGEPSLLVEDDDGPDIDRDEGLMRLEEG